MHDDHDTSDEPEPGREEPDRQDDRQDAASAPVGLSTLIARHLDGGLDAAGQRTLARHLAESATARGMLAEYLRLEAALLRLGLVGALGREPAPSPAGSPRTESAAAGGGDPPGGGHEGVVPRTARRAAACGPRPVPAAGGGASAAGRRRAAALALVGIAVAALLAVAILPRGPAGGPADQPGEDIDRMATAWLQTSRRPVAEPGEASPPDEDAGVEPDAGSLAGPPSGAEPDGGPLAGPPSWLVAAMADEEFRRVVPDPG